MENEPAIPKIVDVQNDDTRVTINKGSSHGVRVGQRYMLFRVTDKLLVDPDTGEELGKLEIPLGTGKVIYIQEKWATIESDMLRPPQSRTIKKLSNPHYSTIFSPIPTQEITEIPTPGLQPFDSPREGDYAKPI